MKMIGDGSVTARAGHPTLRSGRLAAGKATTMDSKDQTVNPPELAMHSRSMYFLRTSSCSVMACAKVVAASRRS